MTGAVVSVNVGAPRVIEWRGRAYETAFIKEPVAAALPIRETGIEGDRQADQRVHGGRNKAVYAYPREHYVYWEQVLDRPLAPGAFGENLTTAGMMESEINIGDVFDVGTARLLVTQPRMPCVKMSARFQRPDIQELFLSAGRCGYYFRVVETGEVKAGDSVQRIERDPGMLAVSTVFRLLGGQDRDPDPDQIGAMLDNDALGDGARKTLERRLRASTRMEK